MFILFWFLVFFIKFILLKLRYFITGASIVMFATFLYGHKFSKATVISTDPKPKSLQQPV